MGSLELHIFSEVRQGSNSVLWAVRTPMGWALFGCEPEKGNSQLPGKLQEVIMLC